MEKYCVVIDVDKQTFKVCLMLEQADHRKIMGSCTFSNRPKGFEELLLWTAKKLKGKSAYYVMEATGVYHEYLAHYLDEEGQSVHIVLSLKSRRYLESLGIRSKTDLIDAKGLAMMGIEQRLDRWQSQ